MHTSMRRNAKDIRKMMGMVRRALAADKTVTIEARQDLVRPVGFTLVAIETAEVVWVLSDNHLQQLQAGERRRDTGALLYAGPAAEFFHLVPELQFPEYGNLQARVLGKLARVLGVCFREVARVSVDRRTPDGGVETVDGWAHIDHGSGQVGIYLDQARGVA